ncbi:hypothetical protein [Bacillus cereus]|uniref:Group-specific protein n=1 Tax=Bacillus cereus MC67 TaxID=1053219 RepID=J8ESS0_BACCE|nr:hypothetical protein [Bacillus cereus]EJQ91744.1 hypothetical protein II3_05484 [Bacillus cereus MC67]EOP00610.1 hypothetical protein II1_05140 [Bacillus cereus MC118]MBJ7987708.1 hypothetical protein [Bacillus cereus]
MFKKLVVGALATGVVLTGGLGTISASAEKDHTIKSFDYVTVDGKNVDSLTKLNNNSNEDVKITMVLPKQNTNGDWLAYGFTSRESLEAFIEKDKQRLKNELNPLGSGGSGPGSTDFYEHKNKGGQYFSWSYGFKNLPSSWNDRISAVSTASPSASYSTTLWEHTSTQGYGKGISFRHSDWYGITANLAEDTTSAIEIK